MGMMAAKGRQVTFRAELCPLTGGVLPFDMTLSVIRDSSGKPLYFVCVAFPSTLRLESESEYGAAAASVAPLQTPASFRRPPSAARDQAAAVPPSAAVASDGTSAIPPAIPPCVATLRQNEPPLCATSVAATAASAMGSPPACGYQPQLEGVSRSGSAVCASTELVVASRSCVTPEMERLALSPACSSAGCRCHGGDSVPIGGDGGAPS